MNIYSHISYPFIGVSLFFLIIGFTPPVYMFLLLILGSIGPDLDAIVFIVQKIPFDDPDRPFLHHTWPTHWPITWSWTIILAIFIPSTIFLAIGFYSHMILDSIACGDGMTWFAPFSSKMLNLCSEKTSGHHGKEWLQAFKQTPFYIAEKIVGVIALGFFVFWLLIWFEIL